MPNQCTLSEDQRGEISTLLQQYDEARRNLHAKLGEIADRWDDQLATNVGDTDAEDRLDSLIRWRDLFSVEAAIPDGL